MKLTTTFKRLRAANACESSYRKLRRALKGTKDTAPINLLVILEHNGLQDALWALRATVEDCDKVARLLAADFAAEVLPIWHKHHPSDNRPALAIQAARDLANELITDQAWSAARSAAESAARSAAESASWSAAESASWSAAEIASWSAAWIAAQSAAESAAESAAWNAVRSAAESAARSAQEKIFIAALQCETTEVEPCSTF